MWRILLIVLATGLSVGFAHRSNFLPKVDLFDLKEGKAILEFENSTTVQAETELWIRSVSGFADRTNILEFRNGYCLRIPTSPVNVKNELIDTSIQNVFLMLDPTYPPVLLVFDVNWPKRYLVYFSHDVRPFLKKLGIWETIKYSFPPAYGSITSSH